MILVDLNILVDVILKRQPHLASSASIVNRIANGRLPAALAAHNVTTMYYLVHQWRDEPSADRAVDWALRNFEIAPVGASEFERARAMRWPDFEDAVVAAAAEAAGCETIITRNVRDFRRSPVPALVPEELVINEIHESFVRGYA